MKLFKLAALLFSAAAVGLLGHSSASAQTTTVDAGAYTISFNDYYFGPSIGVSLSQTGDKFTFSNLDYLATTKGTVTGEGRASFRDWLYGAVVAADRKLTHLRA